MEQVTIEALSRKERVSKTGRPFTSLGLKTKQHGAKWLSGFDSATTKNWKVGDTVEIEIEQKGEYLNFTTGRKDSTPQSESRTNNLIEFKVIPMLENIHARILRLEGKDIVPDSNDGYPPMDETNNSNPF